MSADGDRLDRVLLAAGRCTSRTRAQQLVRQGRVRVDGVVITRPATVVGAGARLEVDDDGWVSRAAHKLLGALDDLDLQPAGTALDAGASTGGFTQVLLSRGCSRVHAVDVGHGQLDPGLRADSRVVVRERLNLRELGLADVEATPVDWVVADVSFISLTLLLAPLVAVTAATGSMLLLVKPQFEVGRERLEAGGVVRSAELRREAVDRVAATAAELGWPPVATAPSRLPGADGNLEIFLLLRRLG